METFVGVLTSAGFLEKVFLLLVGAMLTGIVVPIVKFYMNKNRFKQEKLFEADLSRQEEIVKARSKFLQDLADPLWQFQLLALQVSYYHDSSDTKFQTAWEEYDRQSWQYLTKIRALVGGSRWFTSEAA
jgi:ABC-type Fe3+ transport system substrate-binding protein